MPFKSKAQRRKFAQLLVEGKISDETYEEWNRSTGRKELPERVTPAQKRKTARKGGAKKRAAKKSTRKSTKKRAAKKSGARKSAKKRASKRK